MWVCRVGTAESRAAQTAGEKYTDDIKYVFGFLSPLLVIAGGQGTVSSLPFEWHH